MNEIANNLLEKRNKEHYDNLKVAKTWIKSLMDKIEFETTPVNMITKEVKSWMNHRKNWKWTKRR